MFVDESRIRVEAGNGGRGIVSFFPGKNGPDGGNGGDGGNVYAKINPQLYSLYKYLERRVFKAKKGGYGQSNRRAGAAAPDLILEFPPGTSFIDLDTNEEIELSEKNSPLLLARGGLGGNGNDSFKSSTNRTPMKATDGTQGQIRNFKVILKLIAEYGFIGLPNAGKSTLLNELTAAHVKTANYPFTTLEPNLGVFENKVLADIPGLIEGASQGKGLGTKFLKHIEKVKLLLHCIGADSTNIKKDYQTVVTELSEYNEKLVKKNAVILLTKSDLISEAEVKKKIKILKTFSDQVYAISVFEPESLEVLKTIIRS